MVILVGTEQAIKSLFDQNLKFGDPNTWGTASLKEVRIMLNYLIKTWKSSTLTVMLF